MLTRRQHRFDHPSSQVPVTMLTQCTSGTAANRCATSFNLPQIGLDSDDHRGSQPQ